MDFVWATRGHQSARHLTIPQAVHFARQHQALPQGQAPGQGQEAPPPAPVVMAEVTDNPGSGKQQQQFLTLTLLGRAGQGRGDR